MKKTILSSLPAPTCPCGSSVIYLECCAPFHRSAPAPTAERLMRARYSAYVLEDNAFIFATWHASTRPAPLGGEQDRVATAGVRWLGLDVRHHAQDGDHATVEFVARYKQGGRAQRIHEISRFVREAGWWWYLDGTFPAEKIS